MSGSLSLSIVSVPVSNPQRARDFYTHALGFTVIADTEFEREPGRNARWIQLGPRSSGTSIALVTWFESMPPGSMKGLVLEVDELDPTIDMLASRGVQFLHEPLLAPWGRFTSFDDPDGNGWVLQDHRERAST